jgi:glycosyltransferase involved in cell wall biosynthesis
VYHQIVSEGGLERYLLGLARGLRDRGHELTLVTARTDGEAERLGVGLVRVGLGWRRGPLEPWGFARAVGGRRFGADVVLGFGRTPVQDIHRAGGGCHAVYSRLLPWYKRWGLKNRIELALERRLYTAGGTRHFVVNSEMVAAQLCDEYLVPADRVSVVHTAVDTDAFRPPVQRPENPRPHLLFVSSHHRRKGLDALLRAMTRLPQAMLSIAGAPLGGRYRRMFRRLGLEGRIEFLGAPTDLAPIYARADWFVHPTLYDACANTVLQSMAAGLPGLISVADGASGFIDDGVNGFLLRAPQDEAAVAGAIERALACTPDQRLAMSAAARRTVEPLTWEAHLESWEALIQKLASGRPAGRPQE